MAISFNMVRTVGVTLLVLLIVVMGLFFISITGKISKKMVKSLELRATQVERIERIKDLFNRVYKNYDDYASNKINDFQIVVKGVDQLIEESAVLKEITSSPNRKYIDDVLRNSGKLKVIFSRYSDKSQKNLTGAEVIKMEIVLKEIKILLYASIIALRKNIKAQQKTLDNGVLNEVRNGQRVTWIAIGGGIVVGLLVAFFMGHALNKPIRHLVDGTKRIAHGDLDFRVAVKSQDDIGQLAHSFNKMAKDLGVTIKREQELAVRATLAAEAERRKSQELKKTQKDLEGHIVKLDRSNKELEEFAYIASHDLQEPLRKVQTFGDRLFQKYEKVLGDQGKDYLKRMENAIGRMQILISDLLTYSRVTSKAQPFTPVNLNTIVGEVLSDLEIKVEETHAQIHVDDLPTIEADPVQMRQLFQNLISNALKFCKPEISPVVEVRNTVNSPQKGGNNGEPLMSEYIREIRVADNGIGFEEKYKERIFSVFQRLHGRNEYAGTGIGLAVCRKIATRHGGNIGVESARDKGSTFIIRLPVTQPKEKKEGDMG